MIRETFRGLLKTLKEAVLATYGHSLEALVIFGSVGRGTPMHDSDMDILLVIDALPSGRMKRVKTFEPVEKAMEKALRGAKDQGVYTYLSPVFKTPEELSRSSWFLLDMVEDSLVLYDKGVFARTMERLKKRLKALGARRIWRGNAWFWELKPDYKPGETFDL